MDEIIKWDSSNYPFPRGINYLTHQFIEMELNEGKSLQEIMEEHPETKRYIVECRIKK